MSQMESHKRASPSDLISSLPTSVIENILERMPLRDAVRTCVLSKKWEHAWETLPQLVFGSSFGMHLSHEKLLLAIFRVLLTHRGGISKFQLSRGLQLDYHDINRIVNFISRNGIQELSLHFPANLGHKMLPSLFSCLDLKHLRLAHCSIEPPVTFNGWKKLMIFNFYRVSFIGEVIENFFSQFPLLEELRLKYCRNIKHLNIHTCNLRRLWMQSNFMSINVKASLLEKAFIDSAFRRVTNDGDQNPGEGVNVMEFFYCSYGSIKSLEIGYPFLKDFVAGYVPPRLAVHFDHLERVTLRDTCFHVKAEVQCAICLIRSSPCLRHLSILIYRVANDDGDGDTDVMEFLKLQVHSDISLNQLQSVTLVGYKGTDPEIQFVKLMLAKSPLLEIMKIQMLGEIEMEQEIQILREIVGFRRASTSAEIKINR